MTEWLEYYLSRANISILMVTHDRYFLDRVCSEIIEIDNKQIYSYKGNYSYYLEKRQERVEGDERRRGACEESSPYGTGLDAPPAAGTGHESEVPYRCLL